MVVAPRKTGDVVVLWRGRVCSPTHSISHTRPLLLGPKALPGTEAAQKKAHACCPHRPGKRSLASASRPVAQSPSRAIARHNLPLSRLEGGDVTEHASLWASRGAGQYAQDAMALFAECCDRLLHLFSSNITICEADWQTL